MSKYKYPKLTVLALVFVLAYAIFTSPAFSGLRIFLSTLGWFGIFLAGFLYAYGFTSPIASATFLLVAKEQPILLAGLAAGFGAMLANMIEFTLLRTSFMDELQLLADEPIIAVPRQKLGGLVHAQLKGYFMPLIGAFFIASPLPDEIGVSLIAASTKVSPKLFSVISYVLNTIGILMLLYIGTLL